MDKAIEAVAKAICAKWAYDWPSGAGMQQQWLDQAQAALTAYHAHLAETGCAVVPKVPTEGMTKAGDLSCYALYTYGQSEEDFAGDSLQIWESMIEAAAKEQGDG